jgi:hypothetical protein
MKANINKFILTNNKQRALGFKGAVDSGTKIKNTE